MNCLIEFGAVDWDKWTAFAAWFSNLLIFTPMLICFFVGKFTYIDTWSFGESLSGITIAIHNKAQSSLFISHAKLVIQGVSSIDLDLSSSNRIKPDEFIEIPIDYVKYDISSVEHIYLHIHFVGKKIAKKIKVK